MRNQSVTYFSGPMISEKARKFASIDNNDFKASSGWLTSFHEHHRIVFKTIAGEEMSDPVELHYPGNREEKKKIL